MSPGDQSTKLWFGLLIAIQIAIYGVLTQLSLQFSYDSPGLGRPLVGVLALLAIATAAYLASLAVAIRLADCKRTLVAVFVVAIAIRGIILFSEPIQEVDIYRYIWDGAVSSENISPYRFPPADVFQLVESGAQVDPNSTDLQHLVQTASSRPGLREALRRVHFAALPTIYPPISQHVFHFADWLTPQNASVVVRLRVMKAVIVGFDLGVMFLVAVLLSQARMHRAWCLAYGWCPLVIKEFANSGHLDSIAVFFTIASLVCLVSACASLRRRHSLLLLGFAGVFIGFGVGAKLYPVVLLPLLFVYAWRSMGKLHCACFTLIAALTIVVALLPMIGNKLVKQDVAKQNAASDLDQQAQLKGLSTFLHYWEINDLLFMIVEENVRPDVQDGQKPHWFVVTPSSWRSGITSRASVLFGDKAQTPFLLTRLLTTLVFGGIVLWLCWRTLRDPSLFAESAFLTLAWFWFLAPTQNPWYWTWALPLVPFARNRVWLAVAGLGLVYYSRFWFEYHVAVTESWGLRYKGVEVFDFMVVWVEFLPFLLFLGFSAFLRSRQSNSIEETDQSSQSLSRAASDDV